MCELLWLKRLLKELRMKVYYNNEVAINITTIQFSMMKWQILRFIKENWKMVLLVYEVFQ